MLCEPIHNTRMNSYNIIFMKHSLLKHNCNICEQWANVFGWKNTTCPNPPIAPPFQIVVICIIFLQLYFLQYKNITSWIIFILKSICDYPSRFKLVNSFKKSNKHWRVWMYDYICHKIIHVIEFENLNIYSQITVVDGILGWNFLWCMIYWYT
jgi:hypothetical protein